MQCLKVLTMSGWNPPPGNRKMHGDLMYLYIVTVEERHVSVTASTRGFYLNQSVSHAVLSFLKLWDKGIAAKKPPSRVLTFALSLIDGKSRILSLDQGWTPLGGDLTIKLMRTNRITWNVWKDVAASEEGMSFSIDFICKKIAFFGNNVEKKSSWSCIAQQFSLVLSLSDIVMLKNIASSRSTTYTFNPKPANPSFLSHSLVELLSQISPAFKKNFTALQKKRYQCGCFWFSLHAMVANNIASVNKAGILVCWIGLYPY